MGFFFKTKDQKAVLAALDLVEHKYGACDGIMAELRQMVKKEPEATSRHLRSGKEPLEMVLLLVRNTAYERATSGVFHIYRGVPSGTGQRYISVCSQVIDDLVQHGFMSADEADEAKETLRWNVEAMG